MNIHNNIDPPSLDHILSLNHSCRRIRKGQYAVNMTLCQKIVMFFKDLFSSGRKAHDIQDYERYSALIKEKVQHLKEIKDSSSDEFYYGLKNLLHVNAKINFTGWARSLNENEDYNSFKNDLQDLQNFAKQSVKDWTESGPQENRANKMAIKRWIEADDKQLAYAGFSNEIVYKADDVPVGAVLLINPKGMRARDQIFGYGYSWARRLQKWKSKFHQIFTGYALTHAMSSLGHGLFYHIDDKCESLGKPMSVCGANVPIIEDFSLDARGNKGPKYMFGYEILFPNHEQFAKELHCPKEEVQDFLENEWRPTILSSSGENPSKTSTLDIMKTLWDVKRPENYDITAVFEPRPERGYSCSALISVTLAKHGVDVLKQCNKKVDKATPVDLLKTELYDHVFSNERENLIRFRPI